MSVNNKRVFYVKYLAHDIYTEIMKARPDVRLDRLENDSPADVFMPILSAAHAYQIGAARDELARHFHVDKDFLKRTPNLLIVSSNGAGFDPVGHNAPRLERGVVSGGNFGRDLIPFPQRDRRRVLLRRIRRHSAARTESGAACRPCW